MCYPPETWAELLSTENHNKTIITSTSLIDWEKTSFIKVVATIKLSPNDNFESQG